MSPCRVPLSPTKCAKDFGHYLSVASALGSPTFVISDADHSGNDQRYTTPSLVLAGPDHPVRATASGEFAVAGT